MDLVTSPSTSAFSLLLMDLVTTLEHLLMMDEFMMLVVVFIMLVSLPDLISAPESSNSLTIF